MNAVSMEYRVIGHVSDQSEAFVRPFWIVFKMPDYVRGYILRNWLTELGNVEWIAEEYISDLVFEINNQSPEFREGAEALFVGIADLDAGPLRTVALGVGLEQEPGFQAKCSEEQLMTECTREDMDALLSGLKLPFRCLEGVAY